MPLNLHQVKQNQNHSPRKIIGIYHEPIIARISSSIFRLFEALAASPSSESELADLLPNNCSSKARVSLSRLEAIFLLFEPA